MSCIVLCHIREGEQPTLIRRGAEPSGPTNWELKAWFVLESGEKHDHSTTIRNRHALELAPFVGVLVDSLIADLGQEVKSAGWTAMTHGKRGTKNGRKRK